MSEYLNVPSEVHQEEEGADRRSGVNGPEQGHPELTPDRPAPLEDGAPQADAADGEAGGHPLTVVGIGGSAGALDSFEQFFLSLPSGDGMAFVIVTHQEEQSAPEQPAAAQPLPVQPISMQPAPVQPISMQHGLVPEVIQRCTGLLVTQATDGVQLEPNRVYVVPAASDVTLEGNRLRLRPAAPAADGPGVIDSFFASLAREQGARAAAIVFSGRGQDGGEGLKAVRQHGGLTLVQAPASAEYASMPLNAVASRAAQQVLSADELAVRLHALVTHLPGLSQEELFPSEGRMSAPLQLILQLIRTQTGNDFTQYKQSTIVRRIHRRMVLHGLERVSQYARFIRETPGEVTALYKDLTINVTQFFRDPEAFAALQEQLRQYLEEQSRQSPLDSVRVWTPGCATGEEAYSVAMLLSELLEERGESRSVKVQIFATDIDEDSVMVARTGRYSEQGVSGVSPERLARHFVPSGGQYLVRQELRDMVVFAIHSTFGDPPFTRLDLLCCRNMLIYLNNDLQRQLFPLFHYALKPGGLLFLGPAETTGADSDLFAVQSSPWKLFRRRPGPAQPLPMNFGVPGLRFPLPSLRPAFPEIRPPREAEISKLVTGVLLHDYTPPAVVVTPGGDIVHVTGRTGPYLELALGRAGTNVLEMVRDGLRYELSSALRQAQAEHREVVQRHLRFEQGGTYHLLDLIVRPLPQAQGEPPLMVVIFRAAEPPTELPREAGLPNLTQELQRELKYTKEYLRASIEEMEVSVEQLKTANEELQTINEELQSSNEELMTSKEELQSLNEELLTVNTEHQLIISDLAQANDDMRNLLDSAGIATVFLDNALRIKRFTPRSTDVIHLLPADVGRPLVHLTTSLYYERLEQDCLEVLRTLTPFEAEVQTRSGLWFVMKISPYRTFDNFIDGVVLVFTSITLLKTLQRQLSASVLYADEVVNAFPDPLIVMDSDLRVMSANRAFFGAMRLSPEQVQQQPLGDLGGGQHNFRPLIGLLQEVARGQRELTGYAAPFDVPFQGRRNMKFNARQLTSADGGVQLVLLSMEDVTELLQQTEQMGVAGILHPLGELETP